MNPSRNMETKGADLLAEPRTPFQVMLRRLAEAAMSVTHHDAAEYEPEYIHEVQSMERKFRPIVRDYVAGRAALAAAEGR